MKDREQNLISGSLELKTPEGLSGKVKVWYNFLI